METMIDCIIGIDPGANGGLAVYIKDKSRTILDVAKMPKDLSDLRDFFGYYKENYNPIVFLEKLSVRPDDVTADSEGVRMGKLYRIQKLMANYEHLKAILETTGVPYVLVHPFSWQTKLKLREKGKYEEKADRKRRYQRVAQANYPSVKVTLWNADAILIMHFGRYALANEMNWVKANLPQAEQAKLF